MASVTSIRPRISAPSISDRRGALGALAVAGLAWGLTVPMSALALRWLDPAWLVAARFGLAAVVLGVCARGHLRAALRPAVLLWGALGYGAMVLLQADAIGLTSVSQVALLSGIVPGLVALYSMARKRRLPTLPVALGLVGAVGGVELTALGAGGFSPAGDGMLALSSLLAAAWVLAQPSIAAGRDTLAVSAVQMTGAGLASLALAVSTEPLPGVPAGGAVTALFGLVILGTVLPFALYARGRVRVSDELAGACFNLEALVGWLVGIVAFHDPLDLRGTVGMGLVLGGILLLAMQPESVPGLRTADRRSRVAGPAIPDATAALEARCRAVRERRSGWAIFAPMLPWSERKPA